MMSSAICAVNFAYGDGTTKSYSLGPFAVNSDAVNNFKSRLQNFDNVESLSSKKFTNLSTVLVSENGSNLSGIKSATITVSQTTRIYDAANYTP